jgi:hypothetical protein
MWTVEQRDPAGESIRATVNDRWRLFIGHVHLPSGSLAPHPASADASHMIKTTTISAAMQASVNAHRRSSDRDVVMVFIPFTASPVPRATVGGIRNRSALTTAKELRCPISQSQRWIGSPSSFACPSCRTGKDAAEGRHLRYRD